MKFKKEFQELEHTDPGFKSINIDWDVVVACYDCLRVIKDATSRLSEKKYTTANVCLPFIRDLCNILLEQEGSDDHCVREIVAFVREDFLKCYLDGDGLALTIAAVLDPCSKMELVKDLYKMIYGNKAEEHILRFVDELQGIYKCYLDDANNPRSSTFIFAAVGSYKSELDHYLETSVCPMSENFEILAWWSNSAPHFPTLAKMAHDFLAIPVWTDSSALEDEFNDITYLDSDYFKSEFWLDFTHAKLWSEGLEDE